MKKDKIRYYLALFISIFGLIVMISGSSYALLMGKISSSKQQIIKSGNLELTLIERFESMNNSLSTLDDKDGLLQDTVYDFDVKNTGDSTAKYNLKLVNSIPSDYNGTVLDDKYIKIGLVINDEEKGPYTLSEINNILDKEEVYKKEKVSYRLRIWLDKSKTKELRSFDNAKTYLKLELEIEQSMAKKPIDSSGANSPVLSDNMIPVYYDNKSDVWRKADSRNLNIKYRWYDYNNKIWANAVTVSEDNRSTYLNSDVGDVIPMSDINTMWVWVPRYSYTYFNTNKEEEIKIKFEKGTNSSGTIKCMDNVTGKASTSEVCTDSTNKSLKMGVSTYTHPAFWWDKNDNNIRENDEELTGIWVGKFEVSSDTDCTISNYVEVGSGCNLNTIKPKIIPGVSSWRGAMVGTYFNNIYKMRESGNLYGFNTSDEVHMIKNMEWGAISYLANSKYGRCENGVCTKITQNNCSSFITGIGSDSINASSTTSVCGNDVNKYNGDKGVYASTTGNIYGIYDMSGGAVELTMSNQVSADGKLMSGYRVYNNFYNNSGFTGYLYSGDEMTLFYDYPGKRYYDKYSYGEDSFEYTRGKLGDATKEMNLVSGGKSWYNESVFFTSGGQSWIGRGGSGGGSSTGIFFMNPYDGSAATFSSSRAVISNLK